MEAVERAKLGARIRKLRIERGYSQRDIAEPLMTPAYLCLIEAGRRKPSEAALVHIAERLAVEPSELLSGRPASLEAELELALNESRSKAYRGELEDAERVLHKILQQAERYSLNRLHSRVLVVLATLHERKGDSDRALELFEVASRLLEDEPDHLRYEAVAGIARCHHANGDTRLAIHVLESYLLLLKRRSMEDPAARMRILSSLVHFYRAVGLMRRAVEVAEEALQLGSEVQDPEQIACMCMNVARSLLDEGRHADAVEVLRRAEQIYQGLDWPLPAIRTKVNRGIVELSKGDVESARDSFSEALEKLELYPGEQAVKSDVLNELARAERLLGNESRAVELLRDARKVLDRGDARARAFNERELGLSLAKSDPSSAERQLRKAADDFKTVGSISDAANALLELGRLLLRQGRTEEAARVFEEGLEIGDAPRV